MQEAYFGGGCFWCLEAVFQRLKGVISVESGYMGGNIKNPSYKEICSGLTGHVEIVKITFDPVIISFRDLLYVFFGSHDPTTLNRQGNDVGTQYRSVIFYTDENQKQEAEQFLANEASQMWDDHIVTELTALDAYYSAEAYHQNYYNNNASQGYCNFVIRPKIEKLEAHFQSLLK